jgi:hypothetical protein
MKPLAPPMIAVVNVAVLSAALAFVYVRTHALALTLAVAICYIFAAIVHRALPTIAAIVDKYVGVFAGAVVLAAFGGTADPGVIVKILLGEFIIWFLCRFVITPKRPGIVL